VQEAECPVGMGPPQHFIEFLKDTLAGNFFDARRVSPEGVPGKGFDGEFEARSEADSAQHSEIILPHPRIGVTDSADAAQAQVFATVDEINGFLPERVEKEPVDGEIPSEGIGARIGELDALRMPSIGTFMVGAERGHFKRDSLFDYEDDPEVLADSHDTAEDRLDRLRRRAGGDVDIPLVLKAQEHVANIPAGVERLVSLRNQGLDDVQRSPLFFIHGAKSPGRSRPPLRVQKIQWRGGKGFVVSTEGGAAPPGSYLFFASYILTTGLEITNFYVHFFYRERNTRYKFTQG
jgi:hypothetical protein